MRNQPTNYLNHADCPKTGKADWYISRGEAKETLDPEPDYMDLDEGQELVCVVSNPAFDAVAVVGNLQDLDTFMDPTDMRPKRWLVMPAEIIARDGS